MNADLLSLRVRAMTWEAEGVLGLELVSTSPGGELPAVQAGAHVDLALPGGMVRSYSLINPDETRRWCVAVSRDAASRGGSRWIHDSLRPGALLAAREPRNHFALDESAPYSVLIAGGIGITPLLSMARRLTSLGRPWALHYAARTRAQMAFVAELRQLAERAGAPLDLRADHEGDPPLDLPAIVAARPAGAHLYACGPAGVLDAYEAATAELPREQVHLERFASTQQAASAGGFTVVLARSGQRVPVKAGETVLDALLAEGHQPLFSCRSGVCGTCETRVLRGTPDHRDLVLGDAEKAACDRMMICCSGALTSELELDL